MITRPRPLLAVALTAALALGATGAALAQDAGVTPASAPDNPASFEVVVGVGKSQVIELPTTYKDVMIADPKTADILPLNAHSIYVVGKAIGSTALAIYGPGKRLIATVNVVVSADLEGFKARLHEILPDEKDIAVSPANDAIVLSGTATSPAALQQAVTLAESFTPKVVNLLSVEGTQQVMLSVRFVEMERTTAKELGVNINSTFTNSNGTSAFAINTSDTLSNMTAFSQPVGTVAATWHLGAGKDLSFAIDALEDKGLIKTLAEPNLVAMSGDTASFLAGGEFPVPISSNTASVGGVPTITVEYKQFGIALAFTPTILADGMINMVVNPEVSSIDPTVSVRTPLIVIPGIKVRRAHTTVELRDGESFTIAGLLADNYQNNINQLPWVGDIPILGALFRSTGFQRDQTELVIVVTPHLVTARRGAIATPDEHFVPPSDFELYFLGAQRGSGRYMSPADRALIEADPTKGGLDGPHGHILY
ncbi:MAG TPA: type II and III secretion system protein family protein [Caulobacteraceae bacterium]|nr:type II and III secretion system protein family protein [Caulobacteraceae bacterium]